jgi:hypothetical protein
VRSPAPAPRRDAVIVPVIPILRVVLAALALAIVVGIVSVLWSHRDQLFGRSALERYIDPKAYQAVFLTTSQVYFGRLTLDGDVYVLNDVYYINQPDPATQGQLVKRGSEVHGPRDPMLINVQQVLQVENLRDDSQVAQGIRLIQTGQAPPLATPAQTTPRPSATR